MMWTKLLICVVSVNAVLGQLLLKRAIMSLDGPPTSLSLIPGFLLAAAKSPWVYCSLVIQGIGYVLWMILISRVKLGVATAGVAAGFYLLLAVSAWWIYDESMSNWQWIGISLIAAGVTCFSLSPG